MITLYKLASLEPREGVSGGVDFFCIALVEE
jgi:hypothetical protein